MHPRQAPHDDAESVVAVDYPATTAARARRALILTGVLLLLGFTVVTLLRLRAASALASEARDPARDLPRVTVTPARAASASHALALPGETAAWNESTLFARVNGYLAAWKVDIGDTVHKGQVLAVIDTPELDAQLAAAQAQLRAARSQVELRVAEAEFARTTWERWRDSPKGVVSDQDREAKHADLDGAQARLSVARAQEALDRAQVDNIAAMAQYKNVTAPFDGTVVERRIDVGNLVTAGSTAATTPLFRIAQERPIRVYVDAPQSAAPGLLRAGVPARVRSATLPGLSFEARVARSAQALQPQARTLRVEVDLPNEDRRLLPGMYVDVEFQLAGADGVQVPAAAMIFRSGGPQVAVVDAQGKFTLRKVTIARDDGAEVELGSGVQAGEMVALNASARISDGDTVQVALDDGAGNQPGPAPIAPASTGTRVP